MSKMKRRKVGSRKELLLYTKKSWICEDLMTSSLFSHLVDDYSEKLKTQWNDIETTTIKVKEEVDDNIEPIQPIRDSLADSFDFSKVCVTVRVSVMPLCFPKK